MAAHPTTVSLPSSSYFAYRGIPSEQDPSKYAPFWDFHDSFELFVAGRLDSPRVAYTSRLLAPDTAHARLHILCIVFALFSTPSTLLSSLKD